MRSGRTIHHPTDEPLIRLLAIFNAFDDFHHAVHVGVGFRRWRTENRCCGEQHYNGLARTDDAAPKDGHGILLILFLLLPIITTRPARRRRRRCNCHCLGLGPRE